MAQKPSRDPFSQPTGADKTVRLARKDLGIEREDPTQALKIEAPPEADSTLRLKRDEIGLTKEEPTQAFQSPNIPQADAKGVADSTLRLKRDEMGLTKEEPTQALNLGAKELAASTLRLKRDELLFEEPTQAIHRADLATAREVIDDASQPLPEMLKHSVLLPDASDIPDWEEATMIFPAHHPSARSEPAKSLAIAKPLTIGDLDEAPAAATQLMPLIEPEPDAPFELAPSPPPMEATTLMPLMPMVAPLAPSSLNPGAGDKTVRDLVTETMDKTVIVHRSEAPPAAAMHAPPPTEQAAVKSALQKSVSSKLSPPDMEEASAADEITRSNDSNSPLESTMIMPVLPPSLASDAQEPMEKTIIIQASEAPAAATQLMPQIEASAPAADPVLAEAGPRVTGDTEPVKLPWEGALKIEEEPSAFETRKGLAPVLPGKSLVNPLAGSTQLMTQDSLSDAIEATKAISAESSLRAAEEPQAAEMDMSSPLARATGQMPSPPPIADHSVGMGMAMTPTTQLMPAQVPPPHPKALPAVALDLTAPVKVKSPAATRPATTTVSPTLPLPLPPSVPGYPDRTQPLPQPQTQAQAQSQADVRAPLEAPAPLAKIANVSSSEAKKGSKAWVVVAIVGLGAAAAAVYVFGVRTSAKSREVLSAAKAAQIGSSETVPVALQADFLKAKAGDAKAMQMLGVKYYYGLDVPQNKQEGLRWMRQAAAAGSEKAKADLRAMELEAR